MIKVSRFMRIWLEQFVVVDDLTPCCLPLLWCACCGPGDVPLLLGRLLPQSLAQEEVAVSMHGFVRP